MANGTTADQVADQIMGSSAGAPAATAPASGNRADQVADQLLTTKSSAGGVMDFLNRPLISGDALKKVISPGDLPQKDVERQISAGHPVRAAISEFEAGTEKSVSDLASSFTSPASLGLMLTTGGESLAAKAGLKGIATALRIPQLAATAGYGVQGAKQALTPRQPGETTADASERRLFGASAAAGGAAGTAAIGKDAIHRTLRNKLGMNDDLASKVADNIAKKHAAEQDAAVKATTVEQSGEAAKRGVSSEAAQRTVAIEQGFQENMDALRGQTSSRVSDITRQADQRTAQAGAAIPELEHQKIQAGSRIIADASQYAMQERAKFQVKFRAMDQKLSAPIATTDDVRAIIQSEFKDKGVSESEIPPAALKAIKGEAPISGVSKSEVRLTQNELQTLNVLYREGARGEDLRGGLANMGYSPRQIDAMMQTVGEAPSKTGELDSHSVTRVRNDLWDAARAAKDGTVKAALDSAHDKLTNLQENAFEEAGYGKEYRALKSEYSTFKRGIGGDLFHQLLASYDVQDQDIAAKLSKFTNTSTAGAIRTVLKAAGIDVSPLDSISSSLEEAERTSRTAPREASARIRQAESQDAKTATILRSEATKKASDVKADARARSAEIDRITREQLGDIDRTKSAAVKEAEAKGDIVPGKSSSELTGLSNQDLLRERLKAQADHMRASGIGSAYALFNVIYGLMQLAGGSAWGAMHIGRGAGMSAIPDLVRNPDFQNWVIRESGVEPSNRLLTAKMKKGLADMYPLLRRAVASGTQEQATANAPRSPRNSSPVRRDMTPAVPSGQSVWSNPIQ